MPQLLLPPLLLLLPTPLSSSAVAAPALAPATPAADPAPAQAPPTPVQAPAPPAPAAATPATAVARLPITVLGRFGLLALERSGGGPPEAHPTGGLRAAVPLLASRRFSLAASAGYLLGRAADGTAEVNVLTLHHLVDLRLEGGLRLASWLLFLSAGGLLDGAQVHLQALDSRASAFGLHPGALYGLGVQAGEGRWLLRLELAGLRRGLADDLLAELGAGLVF
ncbi:MAG: hypothetical protein FJ125_02755 [Deltaproteobacteria bacterium]|nr:hypothetical protein [Deltaproteobacteria bacterium]